MSERELVKAKADRATEKEVVAELNRINAALHQPTTKGALKRYRTRRDIYLQRFAELKRQPK